MDSRTERLLWFGVSTLIIAAVIYFADAAQFIDALQQAYSWYLLPAFFFGMIVFAVWNYTWYSFFQHMKLGVSYIETLEIYMAGHFLNSITPLGQFGGEPFMAYIISKNTDSSYEEAFSTVLSADIVNSVPGFTFVLGGAAFLLFFGSVNELVLNAVYMALLATVVGGALVYFLWFEAGKIENGVVRLLRYFSSVLKRGEAFVDSVEERLQEVEKSFETIGESPAHLLKVASIAHLSFLCQLFCLYFILLAVGITSDFTPLYFVLSLSYIGNYSPTPGGSGTFEAVMAGLLTVMVPISFASAVVVAILFRATTYWPGMIVGYVTLNTLNNGSEK